MRQSDWEEEYRREETPWDKGEPSPGLVNWLHDPGALRKGTAVVPGFGRGRDVHPMPPSETLHLCRSRQDWANTKTYEYVERCDHRLRRHFASESSSRPRPVRGYTSHCPL
ncbi:MAG: hypothetical protein EXS36_04660 [Pedosphaera sp.]|nr:hypothetical protein [Pedosphaera sp.]